MEKIAAPIDNKNLLEDPFEDEVFGDFDSACDHRDGSSTRHLIGYKTLKENGVDCESGLVDARWKYGDNCVTITLLAVPRTEDWEETRRRIFDSYKQEFKAWECEDNSGLVVEFYELGDKLNVIFYFKCEDEPDEEWDDLRNALGYVREQLGPDKVAVIKAQVNVCYNERRPIETDYDDEVYDLLEEWGEDNDYGEEWWSLHCEFCDIIVKI